MRGHLEGNRVHKMKYKKVTFVGANKKTKTKLMGSGGAIKIITRKLHSCRYFLMGDCIAAFYVVGSTGKEPIISVYRGSKGTKKKPVLVLTRSEVCNDMYRLKERLLRYFIEELASEIEKYMLKDLECPSGFSVESYINWLQSVKRLRNSIEQ